MKEFNLRERAEIVKLAQECSKSLKAGPLIDYFASKNSPQKARIKPPTAYGDSLFNITKETDKYYFLSIQGASVAYLKSKIELQQ
jgi:hypothetical protein